MAGTNLETNVLNTCSEFPPKQEMEDYFQGESAEESLLRGSGLESWA